MEKIRVIDLLSGIGGRSLGFQQAGYEVVYAIDRSPVCTEMYREIVKNTNCNLKNVEDIVIKDLPEADLITAKLITYSWHSLIEKKKQNLENNIICEIIEKKMPSAFLIEIPVAMIISNRAAEFNHILGQEVFHSYSIIYQILKEADYSGFPVNKRQAYMVGIRNDLYHNEFYFPKVVQVGRPIYQEAAEKIAEWYRKVSVTSDIVLEEGKYYVKKGRDLEETDSIYIGKYKDMFVADTRGLRRITHNEYAYLKGFPEYNFNNCKNKYDTYMKIAYASNVFVVNKIAYALKEYLLATDFAQSSDKNAELKTINVKSVKNVKNKINKSEHKIFPKIELRSIHIDNLKGIKNADISFDKNLTAIMGVNGAGKSTILHALACVFKPYISKEDYKFSFFFTPTPDSSWKNSKFSITYWDENMQKENTKEYRKNKDRWARYADRPQRDTYFIGIETCVPEIEKESQTSYIDYKTSLANERNADKIIQAAAYVLNKNYDQLNYHKTKKKELLGVHTEENIRYSSLSMGAGEQRVLRILRTVYTVEQYSLVLIDEIDVLLHVTALKRLISELAKVAEKRKLQVIFTTHSMEMNRLQRFVDIRYLQPLKEKTMVYNRITPDIVYELSEDVEQPIKIYVEDILAETIVNIVADGLGLYRYVKVIKLGAAYNLIVLSASFILQEKDISEEFFLLDGDLYRNQKDKRDAINKVLTGTEKEHDDKVDKAVKLLHQLRMSEKTAPEKYIFDMLVEMDDDSELVKVAMTLKAVSDSHQWLDKLVERMGKSEELILDKIIKIVSEHERWGDYVDELREHLITCKSRLQL